MASQKVEVMKILARMRIPASYIFGITFIIFARPQSTPLFLTISAIGVIIRTWASGCIEKGKTLCKNGPYSLIRHPLYLGTFLIGLGISLTSSHEWAIAFTVLFIVFYGAKIYEEERTLEKMFGDEYREYKKSVSALLPLRIKPVKSDFSIRRAIKNKEYKLWLGLASFLIFYYYFKQ